MRLPEVRGRNYNGYKYDSGFEAEVARELDERIQKGRIKSVKRQHTVKMRFYSKAGNFCFSKSFKVDFLITETNGSLTLYEAKGFRNDEFERLLKLIKCWVKYSEYNCYILRQGYKETVYR